MATRNMIQPFSLAIMCLSIAAPLSTHHATQAHAAPRDVSEPITSPPVDGQPLIEWRRPPLLDYNISPDKAGDLTSCSEDDPFYIEEISPTCAPLLSMYKLFLQLDFAAYEARSRWRKQSSDAGEYRKKALGFAGRIVVDYRQPEWPLQTYLLSKTYQRLAAIHEAWDEWDAAIAAESDRIALLSQATIGINGKLLPQAYKKKGDYLLAKGDRIAAMRNYEQSFAIHKGNAFEPFSSLRRHAEAMVVDAVFARDYGNALDWIARYLDLYKERARSESRSDIFEDEILLQKLVALKIYVHAAQGQEIEMTEAVHLYQSLYKRRKFRCLKNQLFPQVVAPFHRQAKIKQRLVAMGCGDDVLQALKAVPVEGVIGYQGSLLLPPHRD